MNPSLSLQPEREKRSFSFTHTHTHLSCACIWSNQSFHFEENETEGVVAHCCGDSLLQRGPTFATSNAIIMITWRRSTLIDLRPQHYPFEERVARVFARMNNKEVMTRTMMTTIIIAGRRTEAIKCALAEKRIGLIFKCTLMCPYSQHMCQMDFFEDHTARSSVALRFQCDMQVTPPIDDTSTFSLLSFESSDKLLISRWRWQTRTSVSHVDTLSPCAISHSIADCLYLLVFEINYSLPLIIIIKGKERERAHACAPIDAFQPNLNMST